MSWFHGRTEDWEQGIAPTREVVNSLDVQVYDLYDFFVIVAKPWEQVEASWYPSQDHPGMLFMIAYMLFIVYKVVKEIHQRYTNVFDQRLAKVSPNFFDRISTVYRHPPTGGVSPQNPKKKKRIRWMDWSC